MLPDSTYNPSNASSVEESIPTRSSSRSSSSSFFRAPINEDSRSPGPSSQASLHTTRTSALVWKRGIADNGESPTMPSPVSTGHKHKKVWPERKAKSMQEILRAFVLIPAKSAHEVMLKILEKNIFEIRSVKLVFVVDGKRLVYTILLEYESESPESSVRILDVYVDDERVLRKSPRRPLNIRYPK